MPEPRSGIHEYRRPASLFSNLPRVYFESCRLDEDGLQRGLAELTGAELERYLMYDIGRRTDMCLFSYDHPTHDRVRDAHAPEMLRAVPFDSIDSMLKAQGFPQLGSGYTIRHLHAAQGFITAVSLSREERGTLYEILLTAAEEPRAPLTSACKALQQAADIAWTYTGPV